MRQRVESLGLRVDSPKVGLAVLWPLELEEVGSVTLVWERRGCGMISRPYVLATWLSLREQRRAVLRMVAGMGEGGRA